MFDLKDAPQPAADPAQWAKFQEFLGRDPDPTAAGKDIYHIRAPAIPGAHYEWHPKKRVVYRVVVNGEAAIGEPIAHEIVTHGDALNAVLIYLRGFRAGRDIALLERKDTNGQG